MNPAAMAAIANVVGTLVSSLSSKGGGESQKKLTNYTGGQENVLKQITNYLSQGGQEGYRKAMDLLQQYMDPESQTNQEYEEPYMRAFQEKTIPGLAEEFGGGAHGGALSSSGFGQSLSAAGGRLQSDLAGQKRDRTRQALMDFLGQRNQEVNQTLGAQPFSYVNKNSGAPSGNAFGGFLQGMTPGIMEGAKNMFSRTNPLVAQAQNIRG